MRALSLFLFIVGIGWLGFLAWVFFALSSISQPISGGALLIYWGAMTMGPLMLIVGSFMLMRGTSSRFAFTLIVTGCVLLTALVLYNSIQGMQRRPLELSPAYWFYAILLTIVLLADFAAFKIWRLLGR